MTASPTDDLASAERRIRELTKELSQARGELAESREQQATTAGILAALSSSPADLRHVCAEIAESAARLCDAYDAAIRQVDGERLRLSAHHGPIPVAGTLPLIRSQTSWPKGMNFWRAGNGRSKKVIASGPRTRQLARF